MSLDDLLAKLPDALREAIEEYFKDPEIMAGMAQSYLDSSDEDQAGMMEFINAGGPKILADIQLEQEDGTPTSEDLKGHFDV